MIPPLHENAAWPAPREFPALAWGEIHVWRIALDGEEVLAEEARRILSADEIGRAGRFRFDGDRLAYIHGRLALRKILAGYLRRPPATLVFQCNPWGKPSLGGDWTGHPFKFNLSHSGRLGLLGVSLGSELGVDIERLDDSKADERIAARFFAPGEMAALGTLVGEEWVQGFFNCWTRKEAYIKARGEGLSIPLNGFEMSLRPGVPVELIHGEMDFPEAENWTIVALDPDSNYTAALAVRSLAGSVRCFTWPGGLEIR